MRRTVLIAPGLVGEPGGDSVLRQNLPSLSALVEIGTVFKLDPVPSVETPEALYLGMAPADGQLRQGPLTVSALGADPPDRSTHFHLSLLSLEGDRICKPSYIPTAEHERLLWDNLKALDTKTLTLLKGEHLDHGLVWEGLGDFQTYAPTQDRSYREHRPEGDAENQLRRLIDDSVNVLSELEINQRRRDEGLPPFNILWPWGEGRRSPVPNLALKRAEPATVESFSLRLQGLARLAGYAHVDRSSVARGLRTRFSAIAKRCLARDLTIVLLDPEGLTLDEKDWFVRELDRELLSPLLTDLVKEKSRLTVLSPAATTGLALTTASRSDRELPFDERTLEEKNVPIESLWRAVEEGVRSVQ